jgi:hypothetical protein
MDRTPPPMSLAAALALPRTPGRSSEVFIDGDLEIRFAARPTNGPQVPHQRDEVYVVAAGTGGYRVQDTVTEVAPGDILFCAAHLEHGFEDISDNFCVWVIFYGPARCSRKKTFTRFYSKFVCNVDRHAQHQSVQRQSAG